MRAVEVLQRLEQLHGRAETGEWTFHREVWHIDAFAVRLWKGRDAPHYRRVAYEVKVAWSDFTAELKKPGKRANAVALSHQFYFAMPHELAVKALPRIVAEAPECGLIAVSEERPPGAWSWRSPFVGAGYCDGVRVLRSAPIRKDAGRDWKPDELATLMRRAHAPVFDEQTLRWQLEMANEQVKSERAQVRRSRDAERAAMRALARRLGHTVEAGTEWTGPWERAGQKRDDARVRVQEVSAGYSDDWPARVSVELLNDAGEPVGPAVWSRASLEIGPFLAAYAPAERLATVRKVV